MRPLPVLVLVIVAFGAWIFTLELGSMRRSVAPVSLIIPTASEEGVGKTNAGGDRALRVRVETSDDGRLTVQKPEIESAVGVQVDITLKRSMSIGGRVTTDGDEALDKVKISAYTAKRKFRRVRLTVFSDELGEFQLEDMPAGSYTLMFDKFGFESKREHGVQAGTVDVSVELMRHGTVSGRVLVAGSGRPVRDFGIMLRHVTPHSAQTISAARSHNVEDSQDGSFTVSVEKPGSYIVEVTHEKYAGCFSEVFTIAKGQEQVGVDVLMTMGGSMVGRIVDGFGKPIRDALIVSHDCEFDGDVYIGPPSGSLGIISTERRIKTNSNGRFELKGLTPSDYLIQIDHPQYAAAIQRPITVQEGQVSRVPDVILIRGGRVHGVVYGPDKMPLPGALVLLETASHTSSYSRKANARGEYEINNVVPDRYSLNATRSSQAGSNPFLHIQDMSHTRTELRLRDGQDVRHDFHFGSAADSGSTRPTSAEADESCPDGQGCGGNEDRDG